MKRILTFYLISVILIFTTFAGCSRKFGEPKIFTGGVISKLDILKEHTIIYSGKHVYATVNREWILWAYDDFRNWLAQGQYGVLKWDDRSQCTLFSAAFEVYCQIAFFRQAFHDSIPAQGIAVGTIWYLPNYPIDFSTGHAINMIITQNGMEYFEPQTGKFITLTSDQISTAFLKKFD